MFVRNAWYCAGWTHEISQALTAVRARRIAGESLVLYRKPDGGVVAMEDRCPHRQAPLSLGRKEGDSLRCNYHGMKFGPDGACTEIPGQAAIPPQACVRVFPVVERDGWVWVWMGDPALADPALICFAVGPDDPAWNIKTSEVRVETNYRLEIANLMDLSHIAWVHDQTFGGTRAYETSRPRHTLRPRGVDTELWLRNVPAPRFAQHLFPPETRFDLLFDLQFSVPCNFIMHFQVFTAGSATEGPSDGHLALDTYTCQAVTPCDADSVHYYYSWGASKATDSPGLSDLLKEAIDAAFLEDKAILEGQHRNMKDRPDHPRMDIVHDAGPGKMLWVLDKMLKAEAATRSIPITTNT
jgi:vanillate O-demethylase monooxygenase subunit